MRAGVCVCVCVYLVFITLIVMILKTVNFDSVGNFFLSPHKVISL